AKDLVWYLAIPWPPGQEIKTKMGVFTARLFSLIYPQALLREEWFGRAIKISGRLAAFTATRGDHKM
ncbi:MAG: hypothetical protein WEE51_06015, partial [Pirellulaceae bacterium]